MPVPRKLSSLRKATGCRKGLLDPTMNGGGSLPCEWNIPTEAAAAVSGFFHREAQRLVVEGLLRTPKTGAFLNLSCWGGDSLLTLGVALVVFRHLVGLT